MNESLAERLRALSKMHNSEHVMKMLSVAADEIEHLEGELEHTKSLLTTARDYGDDNVWYWQGDGEDYPESLVCPVVISARDLRGLLPRTTLKENEVGHDTKPQGDFNRAMSGV